MTAPKSPTPRMRQSASDSMTLDDIFKTTGISRERVRQIETTALAKLKRILAMRGITKDNLLGDI